MKNGKAHEEKKRELMLMNFAACVSVFACVCVWYNADISELFIDSDSNPGCCSCVSVGKC